MEATFRERAALNLQWLQLRGEMVSWIRNGAYMVGRLIDLSDDLGVVMAKDWHTGRLSILFDEEVATLRPYPAEPIPEPEART